MNKHYLVNRIVIITVILNSIPHSNIIRQSSCESTATSGHLNPVRMRTWSCGLRRRSQQCPVANRRGSTAGSTSTENRTKCFAKRITGFAQHSSRKFWIPASQCGNPARAMSTRQASGLAKICSATTTTTIMIKKVGRTPTSVRPSKIRHPENVLNENQLRP